MCAFRFGVIRTRAGPQPHENRRLHSPLEGKLDGTDINSPLSEVIPYYNTQSK